MSDPTNAAEDPFAHLHDEGYADAFDARRATHAQMIAMGGRATIPLDGPWRFTLDLFDEGLRQKWYADAPTPAKDWITPRDYDAGQGATMDLPACWTMARPEWRHFEGGAWFTRMIAWTPKRKGDRLFLRVGAAASEARVFLNGVFLASHRGASTPFFVELTDAMTAGDNRLQINVDNRRAPDRVPMHHFDWFNHGGLYREVALIETPAALIADAGAHLIDDGSFSRIAFDVVLDGAQTGVAHIEIAALELSIDAPIAGGRSAIEVDARPELWSPESPTLYDVVFTFGEDRIVERVGFRTISRSGHDILLNGRPLFLRGVCVHEDDAALGKVSTEADVRRRLAHARELGCNALRLAHYPHHEHVAAIADEVGMLLWEEIPVYWAIAFDDPKTYADAENQLLEMIRRDRNRASVILWGVGNENADTQARYRFMAALAKAARAADPTRLVGAACLINRETFRIEDRLAQHLDVIGLNEYFGWYEPEIAGLERLIANSNPDRPVVISETGADALAGHHGSPDTLFTEERQAQMLARQIAATRGTPWLKGFFPWLLYDFRSERRQTVFQQGWNRKGLIAEDKATKKQAFAVVAAYYAERREEH